MKIFARTARIESPTYSYNGNDSEIDGWLKNFTSRIGDGTGDPEEEFLSQLKLLANCKPCSRYLDVGSGLGRIIDIVKPYVDSLVGLEPDYERFKSSCNTFRDDERVRMLQSTTSKYKSAYPEDRFDIVSVSMVIQHIPTGICDEILGDVRELLKPDGVAIISTTQQDVERYVFEFKPTPQSVEEFNRYALDTGNQKWGIPVRNFSKTSFHRAIERAGLRTIHWGQFAYIRPEKLTAVASIFNVAPDAIRDLGTSQYAIVKRGAGASDRWQKTPSAH